MLNDSQILTIKQEEAVEVLMMEEFSQKHGVDDEIQKIIKEANSQNIYIAQNKFLLNRGALNIDEENFDITNLVEEVQNLTHQQSVQTSAPIYKKQGILEEFDQKQMEKLRIQQNEFIEIQRRYPKVKECLMQKVQYPCVRIFSARAERWFAFNGKDIADVTAATLFMRGQIQFRIYCMDEQVYCFTNVDNFCEPLVLKPGKNKVVSCIANSFCKKYIVIGMGNEIVVYEVNSHKSISLIKNVTDLKVEDITNVGFCGNGLQRIFVIDGRKQLMIVTIQNTFLFYRVQANRMDVCLGQIIVVEPLKMSIDEDQFHLVAICSLTEVAIYLLSPSVQLLHLQIFQDELARARIKSNIKGNSVGQHSVDVKWRYDPSNSMKPQLIISFWNKIIILKMTEADNDVVPFKAQFDKFLHYTNHYPILSIGLLTYNHLLVHSMSNVVVVAIPLITSFEPGQQCEQSSIVFVDSKSYTQSFKSSSSQRSLMLLSQSKLDIFQVVKLQQYIDRQLGKGDYMNIFCLLLLISKGLNYCFQYNYEQSSLTKIIFYSIESLLVSLSKIKIDDNTLRIRLYWVCQLLIQSQRQSLIWTLVYSIVNNTLRKTDILFESLESFFLKGNILEVPEDIFYMIVKNYVARGRSKILLKSFLTVNLQGHNVERYLQMMNQKQMYSLFIYLFQNLNEQADYLTPFIKIFSNFKAAQTSQQKQYLGKLSLWYLYKSFRGFKFPNTVMSSKERELSLKGLLILPLNPTFSKHFFQFSEELFLTIYLFVCTSDEIINYVKEDNTYFAQKLKDFDQKTDLSQAVLPQMVSFIKRAYKKQSAIIYHFVAMCSIKIKLQLELLYETSLYYLSYPNLLIQSELKIINILEKDQGKILLLMLIRLRPLLKSNKLYLKKLLAHKSYDWEVVSYLHFLDGKYQVAIQSLLDSQKRDNIFQLLKQIIQQVSENKSSQKQIKDIVFVQIGRLIKIDPVQALKLMNLLHIDIETTLKYLKKAPEVKLQLITSIINRNQKQGDDQNMGLLIEHLQLVCQFDNRNVMKYLHSINYPLDQATKICQRYNHFEGKAYMLQRSGDITGALSSYEKAIISKIKDKEMIPSILKSFLQKYFQAAINICKNNPCSSSTPIEENHWIYLMQLTRDIQDSNHSQKVDVMIQLNNYFMIIYQNLFNYVPAKILLQYFLKGSRGFLPRMMLKSWYTLSILFRFEYSMYKMAVEINILDTNLMVDLYSDQKWRGIFMGSTDCDFCDNPLTDEQQIVLFSCGHGFHKICHKSKCCLVCKFQSDSLLVKSLLERMTNKRKQSQCWSINSAIQSRSCGQSQGVMVIELQSGQQRRKRLRPKLKAFDYEVMKGEDSMESSFEYYFSNRK